ncbi:hypothetical protein ACN27F_01380 [Solwaraspora sp. WMMB335]|uniref:hypothetical protein n=1 Tax=Solwaraspora sp. WMMB335 TaxID=3404118 RepID=UPI003B964DB0
MHTVGFRHAPRPLGLDEQGREVLTYQPGTVPWPERFDLFVSSDAALRRVGRLIRDLHDAAAGFVPPRRHLATADPARRHRPDRPPRPGTVEPGGRWRVGGHRLDSAAGSRRRVRPRRDTTARPGADAGPAGPLDARLPRRAGGHRHRALDPTVANRAR